jgi:hypothetical protein
MQRFYNQVGWILLGMLLFNSPAIAGRIDEVKKQLKETCKKEVPDSELMEVVKKALDCEPGTKVKIGDCVIKCVSQGGGRVVGE